jgi:hypothetical protein
MRDAVHAQREPWRLDLTIDAGSLLTLTCTSGTFLGLVNVAVYRSSAPWDQLSPVVLMLASVTPLALVSFPNSVIVAPPGVGP